MLNYALTLSKQQKENPEKVLEDFIQDFKITELKETLWSWYKSTVNEDFSSLEKDEKQLISNLFERLNLLIEALEIKQNSSN